MPGMLAALAAVITATAGLLSALRSSDKPPALSPDVRTGPSAGGGGSDAASKQAKNADATMPGKNGAGVQPDAPISFDVVSATPNVGSPLPLGQPVELSIAVRYKLTTPPEAVFGVYLEEFPPGDATCSGNVHHTGVGKLMLVSSQSDTFHMTLKWQRKAGDTYKNGGAADHGFLSVGGNLWQDSTGRAGTLLHAFGNNPAVCIPYG